MGVLAKAADGTGTAETALRTRPAAISEKSGAAHASHLKAPVKLAAMPKLSDKASQRHEKFADVPVADDMGSWAADASARDGKPLATTPSDAGSSKSKAQTSHGESQPPSVDQAPKWSEKYAEVTDADYMDHWAADSSARNDKIRTAVTPPVV